MKKIKIFDTTLRDGEQSPGCSMTKEEKIIIAKKLNDMKVDIIEAGFAASNENDFEAIKEISKVCDYSTITSLARLNRNDIDKAYEAIKEAKNKRIHTFIGTSDTHIFDKLGKTKEEIKIMVKEMVSYAKSKCNDIEFSLEDATRTDKDFACEIINIAIENGATTINIPDTVGYTTPIEFYDFITYLINNSRLKEVDISVHCHNDLGNATSNSMISIIAGANQIECTINGIGERAGNTALEEIIANIDTRKDYYKCYTDIDLSKIKDISDTVINITGSYVQHNKPIVGDNAFKHEAGIHQAGVLKNKETYEIMNPEKYGIYVDNMVIGIHSGKNVIIDKLQKLGYNLDIINPEQILISVKEYFENSNEEFTIDTLKNITDQHINNKIKMKNK